MKAELNYIRIAPRKMRLVADMVRSKGVGEAKSILKFSKRKGSRPLSKLLDSALANARTGSSFDPAKLRISKLTVDEGPVFKRFMARARGTPALIRKKTSRIKMVLSEK